MATTKKKASKKTAKNSDQSKVDKPREINVPDRAIVILLARKSYRKEFKQGISGIAADSLD